MHKHLIALVLTIVSLFITAVELIYKSCLKCFPSSKTDEIEPPLDKPIVRRTSMDMTELDIHKSITPPRTYNLRSTSLPVKP